MPVWRGESLDRDAERYHRHARELTGSAPNLIWASASQSVAALQQGTQSVPIVLRSNPTHSLSSRARRSAESRRPCRPSHQMNFAASATRMFAAMASKANCTQRLLVLPLAQAERLMSVLLPFAPDMRRPNEREAHKPDNAPKLQFAKRSWSKLRLLRAGLGRNLLRCMNPEVALFRRRRPRCPCLFTGLKRTHSGHRESDANDPLPT
jgi:hypothetical protein